MGWGKEKKGEGKAQEGSQEGKVKDVIRWLLVCVSLLFKALFEAGRDFSWPSDGDQWRPRASAEHFLSCDKTPGRRWCWRARCEPQQCCGFGEVQLSALIANTLRELPGAKPRLGFQGEKGQGSTCTMQNFRNSSGTRWKISKDERRTEVTKPETLRHIKSYFFSLKSGGMWSNILCAPSY